MASVVNDGNDFFLVYLAHFDWLLSTQARTRVLSQLVKKNTMQNTIPVLLELKRYLEQRQSPVLKYLMRYLSELYSDQLFRKVCVFLLYNW